MTLAKSKRLFGYNLKFFFLFLKIRRIQKIEITRLIVNDLFYYEKHENHMQQLI